MSTPQPAPAALAAKRGVLASRARLISAIRDFFYANGYLEVETPTLSRCALPEANIEPIVCADGNLLLPSPEAFMKPLLEAGYDRIFQLGKCYRAGELGLRHRPEFTMLEWYRLGADYLALMDECEEFICYLASRLRDSQAFVYAGKMISMEKPFLRISLDAAFKRFARLDLPSIIASGNFDEVFAEKVEPNIPKDKAVFLYDYPLVAGGFAKKKAENQLLTERFELYVGGLEIANACSEIDCARENAERIALAISERAANKKYIYPLPPYCLEAGRQKPPYAGAALGVDRLAMLFANAADISAVIAFA